jgi:hypothetical protein
MDVDPTQKYLVSAGQDKKLSIYTLNQPKVIRSYKTSDIDSGEILKVSLDPAGVSSSFIIVEYCFRKAKETNTKGGGGGGVKLKKIFKFKK